MPRRNSSSGEEAPLSAESSSDASSEDEVPALLNEAVHTGNLQLSSRMLDAVPPAVWTCAGLTRLDLSSNSFTHLPRQLSELWALEELDVSWNKLEELPGSTLGALTRLVTLRASYNQINAIPQQVASLPYLTSLDLSDNKLTSLPSVLCQSMSIQCLRLNYNSISEIPRELGLAPQLQEVGLEGNPLRNVPKHIVAQGTAALRAYFLQAGAPVVARSSTPPVPGDGASVNRGSGPQVLLVEEEEVGEEGELIPSPSAHRQPYDEEMLMMGDVGVSTDWSRIGSNNSPDLSSNILHSLSLTETETELGSGAEAVLARTANLLSSGLQEIRSGRPLTAGGSHVAPPSERPNSASRRPPSAARRPGSSALFVSSSGLQRPMSARPTTSGVHCSSSIISHSNGSARSIKPTRSPSPSSTSPATWMERAMDAHAGAHYPAAGSSSSSAPADTLLMSMPALTFPLAASMSKLSRRTMGVRLTSASGTEVEMKSMRPSSGKHAPGTLVASSSHSSGDEDEDDALVMQLLERQNPGLLKVVGPQLDELARRRLDPGVG